ncbi:MAG: hypothetical protein AB8B94_09865 [Hyphomicrobiales bacterium]
MLQRTSSIEPVFQGEFDGLCGVYAIINAIRKLYPKRFSPSCQSAMFELLTDYAIKEQGNLSILTSGIGLRELKQLIKVAVEDLKEEKGFRIRVDQPWRLKSNKALYVEEIKHLLDQPNVSILIGIDNPYKHWTVMNCYNDDDLELLDSTGHEDIPFEQLLITHNAHFKSDDYVITPNSIFVLTKEKSGLI